MGGCVSRSSGADDQTKAPKSPKTEQKDATIVDTNNKDKKKQKAPKAPKEPKPPKEPKSPKEKKTEKTKANKADLKELTEDELQLLEANTKLSRTELIELHKNFLKECPSGKLTKKDFLKLFNEMHPLEKKQKADKFCDYIFNVIDSKKSGFITFKDFVMCFCIISFGDFKDKCEFAFKLFDLDKDGKISKTEMTKVLEALYELNGISAKGNNAPAKRVEEIMKKLNQDKKEQKFINKETFIEACKNDETIKQYFIDAVFNLEQQNPETVAVATPAVQVTTASALVAESAAVVVPEVLAQAPAQIEITASTTVVESNTTSESKQEQQVTKQFVETAESKIEEIVHDITSKTITTKEEVHEFKESSSISTSEIKNESSTILISSSEQIISSTVNADSKFN